MSKSWGNAIWLTDTPDDMFGKVMSLKDELIVQYFTLSTNASMEEIEDIKNALARGENPMVFKKELAHRIISELHSKEKATAAQTEFETRFQKHNLDAAALPSVSINTIKTGSTIIDIVTTAGLAASRSEAKRHIEQKAVRVNNTVIESFNSAVTLHAGDIVEVGRKAVKITSEL